MTRELWVNCRRPTSWVLARETREAANNDELHMEDDYVPLGLTRLSFAGRAYVTPKDSVHFEFHMDQLG
jgi:hypothetical protein